MLAIFFLGCFYYVLANLLPEKRSTVDAVQLIAVAKTKDIREHGLDSLLKPFVDEINALSVSLSSSVPIY